MLNPLQDFQPAVYGTAEIRVDTPRPMDRVYWSMRGHILRRERYTRLFVNGKIMMSDAEFELVTNQTFVRFAHGRVLIAGLGLGLILRAIRHKRLSVTVLEQNPDVIHLVAPTLPRPQPTILLADARTWRPTRGQRYDTIYLDIWPYVNADIRREAARLERRYRRWLAPRGWIGTWPACCPIGPGG